MFETVLNFIISLLLIPQVQALIVIVLLAIIGWMIQRWAWTRHVVSLALGAYEYAEEQGLVQNLRGYQKFDPFMDNFTKEFRSQYGRDPTPKDRAKAVEVMEKEVKKTH
ncbi:MAG: hypothetical protein PWR10_1556 [Halanaerobiales bacterium]|nr:hypothetical protein [Halanaerobiales bacterium]